MNATTPATAPITHHNRHANPVVAFIIGLSIILLASILNAAGLNLTKLDHVRTSLIGSTLALEYMRAEYVAPLGSSSLVFNFLFARFLVGTPVTSTDIYVSTVVVVLAQETDVDHLTSLWRRGGWLGYFFFMAIALILLVVATGQLDAVFATRSDLNAVPFAPGLPTNRATDSTPRSQQSVVVRVIGPVQQFGRFSMALLLEWLEAWTAPKDDTTVAWTLGIGWACCGGGLAGGCLNPGNQFGHVAPIFTFILLAVTAVMQIICLNRGLKVYDSTLVVPVFHGVYTASWLLGLSGQIYLACPLNFTQIFNNEPGSLSARSAAALGSAGFPRLELRQRKGASRKGKSKPKVDDRDDEETMVDGDEEELWRIGDASEGEDSGEEEEGQDEDVDHHQHPLQRLHGEEGEGLLPANEEAEDFAPLSPASHSFRDNLEHLHR
ncbi:hypothetical protein R3P38DRAFT_3303720 [Favolaschia claudopus]|uniref:Uncharacterized protein n=1 Tax=Favolaschia claudopus TaxID=2862362 RepID=A0AAW0DYA1_9AGAR